jgi:hypothetical protein
MEEAGTGVTVTTVTNRISGYTGLDGLGGFKSLSRNSRPSHTGAVPKSNLNPMNLLRCAGEKLANEGKWNGYQ